MKYNLILNVLLFITLGTCSSSKKVTGNLKDLKQEAKAFSLSIIESYFTEDCKKHYNSMSDSILIMDGDGIFSKIGKEDKLCRSVKKAIRDKEKTFQDYIDSYNIEILTPDELTKKFNKSLPDYYKTTDSDLFFIGYEFKQGKERIDNFIWDDMFIFMVRKENQIWTIKGVSG